MQKAGLSPAFLIFAVGPKPDFRQLALLRLLLHRRLLLRRSLLMALRRSLSAGLDLLRLRLGLLYSLRLLRSLLVSALRLRLLLRRSLLRRSRFLRRSLLRSRLSLALLCRRLLFRRDLLGLIHQPHQRHRRRITRPRVHAEDLRVTARTCFETRAEALEQLHHNFRVPQLRERTATIRIAVVLAQRDERLDDATQLLRLRHGRLDRLMAQQRRRHVTEHGPAVRGIAAQLPAGKLVTHCYLLSHFGFKSHPDRHRA